MTPCPFCGKDCQKRECTACGTTWGSGIKRSHKTLPNSYLSSGVRPEPRDIDANGGYSNARKDLES